MKMEVLFPFIIGKVLTVFADPANKTADLVMFPFLIGKVLTKICQSLRKEFMFPFLIGKVLTG